MVVAATNGVTRECKNFDICSNDFHFVGNYRNDLLFFYDNHFVRVLQNGDISCDITVNFIPGHFKKFDAMYEDTNNNLLVFNEGKVYSFKNRTLDKIRMFPISTKIDAVFVLNEKTYYYTNKTLYYSYSKNPFRKYTISFPDNIRGIITYNRLLLIFGNKEFWMSWNLEKISKIENPVKELWLECNASSGHSPSTTNSEEPLSSTSSGILILHTSKMINAFFVIALIVVVLMLILILKKMYYE